MLVLMYVMMFFSYMVGMVILKNICWSVILEMFVYIKYWKVLMKLCVLLLVDVCC